MIDEFRRIWEAIHELQRARANFYRKGVVINRDPKTHRCRVNFPDIIDPMTMKPLESGWYQVVAHKTKVDKEYWLPDLGEMVFCLTLSESHEEGIILGSAFNDDDKPPSYANGDTYIISGRKAGKFWEMLAHRNCEGKAKFRFTCDEFHIFGDLIVHGSVRDQFGSLTEHTNAGYPRDRQQGPGGFGCLED